MPTSIDDWITIIAMTSLGVNAWRTSVGKDLALPRTNILFQSVAIYCWLGAIFGVLLFPDLLQRITVFVPVYLVLNGIAVVANQRTNLVRLFRRLRDR